MEQQLLRQTYPAAAMSCNAILLPYFCWIKPTILCHGFQPLAVVGFPGFGVVLCQIPQGVTDAVDAAEQQQRVSLLLNRCTLKQFADIGDNRLSAAISGVQDQIWRSMVDHRVQQVFGNGIRCKRRREQDTVINPVAGFFPVSIVHLSGIYKDHLPRQQPALFAIDAVPHGSVFDVDELKFGMPVIDNGE